MKGGSGVVLSSSGGGDEKWLAGGELLKVELSGFADGLDIRYKSQDSSKVFSLNNC